MMRFQLVAMSTMALFACNSEPRSLAIQENEPNEPSAAVEKNAAEAQIASSHSIGDFGGDGTLSEADSAAMLQWLLVDREVEPDCLAALDIDQNLVIDNADYFALVNQIEGGKPPMPWPQSCGFEGAIRFQILGDYNGDGIVHPDDARDLFYLLLGQEDNAPSCLNGLDLNTDGIIDANDYQELVVALGQSSQGIDDDVLVSGGCALGEVSRGLVYGDFDGNGLIEEADLTKAMDYWAGNSAAPSPCESVMDFDDDGVITPGDLDRLESVVLTGDDHTTLSFYLGGCAATVTNQIPIVGDASGDRLVNQADTDWLVAAYSGGPPPLCYEASNFDGDHNITTSDLVLHGQLVAAVADGQAQQLFLADCGP